MTKATDEQEKDKTDQKTVDPNNDRGYPEWVPRAAVGAFVSAVTFGVVVGLGWVSIGMQDKLQQLGQLGDFVGGITNPLLAFLTFTALIYTINLQRRQLDLAAKQLNVMGQELGLAREEAERSRMALEASSEELKRSASAQEASMASQMETAKAQTDTARLMRQQVRIQNLAQRYKAAKLLANEALERSKRTLSSGDVEEYKSKDAKATGLLAEIDRVASENP